jgi:hypothetical protein
MRVKTHRAKRILFCIVGALLVFFAGSTAITIRSYSFSDTLTFNDAMIATDEGLISLLVPLVRLAHDQDPSTGWVTYSSGKDR